MNMRHECVSVKCECDDLCKCKHEYEIIRHVEYYIRYC